MKTKVAVVQSILFVAFLLLAGSALNAQNRNKPTKISVDLRDAPKHLFHARLEMPVKPGPLTLAYPKWIQGEHSPSGPIVDLAGLHFLANGKDIRWQRDDVDMFAFHMEIPSGVEKLEVTLDYLSPAEANGLREKASTSAKLALLNWYPVSLYPEGSKTDDLTFVASIRLPAGWKYGTALRPAKTNGDSIEFEPVTFTTLIDSPVIAGQYERDIDLSPGQSPEHAIHIAADSQVALQVGPDEVQHLRQLVAETGALFGARHYRHYDFLLTLSDHVPNDGVEHHESSDNRTPEGLFLEPDLRETQMELLPHEFFHSWNGKYRRPLGLTKTDYQQPLTGELLWVYEGLTQYYGVVLAARAGFWTPVKLREYVAIDAAYLNNRPGRTWRDLQDTAVAAQLLYDSPDAESSWRRSTDYYDEGLLIWLDVDTTIRRDTNGKKSLDDFCRLFHGGESGPPKVVPYTFDELVAGLNLISPNDWKGFFEQRLLSHGPGAPLGGIESSGWKLVFTETQNEHARSEELIDNSIDEQYTLGFSAHAPGGDQGDRILDVIPGSPAAQAGLAPGMRLVAVNGRRWTPDILRDVIRNSSASKQPIEILAENDDFFQTYAVNYHGGLRFPHLEELPGKPDVLKDIVRMKAAPVALPTTY